MKFKLLLITFFLSITCVFSQGINYKALIKDGGGNVVASQNITVQFKILQGGTNVYQETHTPTTDVNGIIIINIGEGSVNSGVFTNIDWGSDDHFLNVQINTGGGLTDMGTTQFMAVPYTLHAKTADSLTDIDSFSWSTTGNAGTDPETNFIGTTDDEPLIFKVNNVRAGKISSISGNTSYGYGAGGDSGFGIFNTAIGRLSLSNNTGNYNTATGFVSLRANTTGAGNTAHGRAALHVNTTGSANTAIGDVTLSDNETGSYNTAIGTAALYNNTQSKNTAIGNRALYSNTIGVVNTSTGNESLYSNTTGNHNTATGNKALYSNIDGHWNTAMGSAALQDNISGDMNTAVGFTALSKNTLGNENTAVGRTALFSNIDGDFNTAFGKSALYNNTSGLGNTALGHKALVSNNIGNYNTVIGSDAFNDNTSGGGNTVIGAKSLDTNTSGDNNTAIGYFALLGTSGGDNNIGIGFNALVPVSSGSNQIRIGNNAITHAGIQVAWDVTSDKRWKDNIRALPYGLEVVKQLKPVDYVRKNNDAKTREMGFIAQDIETLLTKVGYTDQGFLHKDDNGYMSIRYNDFIALLTKAIKEQQEIIENQNNEIKSLIEEQESTDARLSRIEAILNTSQQ